MVKCCAPLCGNASYRKLPDITFHRFPKDVNLKNAWLAKIGRKNWQPKPSSVFCSHHFEAHLVDHSGFRSVLAPGAVPTIFDLSFQEEVIDSTHGELDISFQLADPVGRVIVSEYKKPESAHRHTATLDGDYRFCFDNSFSTFSEKTVFFDFMVDSEDSPSKDYDDEKEMELGNAADTYLMRVKDIAVVVERVGDNVSAARRLQELHSAHEARDRNLAEEMCARVLTWSLWQMSLMIMVGFTQVYFLRSLFEDPSNRSYTRFVRGFAQ